MKQAFAEAPSALAYDEDFDLYVEPFVAGAELEPTKRFLARYFERRSQPKAA